jgi:hypothetical protein
MAVLSKAAILVWIAIFATAACTGGTHVEEVGDTPPDASPQQPDPEVRLAPADVEEAEILALCVAESLFPIPDVVNDILYQLAAIRSAYGNTELIRTRARSAWSGEIEIQFGPADSHEFEVGNYFHWNEINLELGPVSIVPLEFGRAKLQFARLFNPCAAADEYANLHGIETATPLTDPSDGPEIFIGFSEWDGYTYLFRYATDDCEHGCREEEFFYFRFNGTDPVLVGRWNPADDGPPAWWTDAMDERIECSCLPRTPEARLKARDNPGK